jgi:hypothetical protein
VSTRQAPRKRLVLPGIGDLLTDGIRLVEVIGKVRDGYVVVDARHAFAEEPDPEERETINSEVIVRSWRIVEYEAENVA